MLSASRDRYYFRRLAIEDVMGNITSVFIQYKCICKYHHNYVSIFCKDIDKNMNLICILLKIRLF